MKSSRTTSSRWSPDVTDSGSIGALAFLGGAIAGLIGALGGLGGGIVITPILTLVLAVPFHQALGASLVATIATSSGAAAAYVRDGLTNVRLGVFLEVATAGGALSGALLAGRVSVGWLHVVFGAVLLASVLLSLIRLSEELPENQPPDRLTAKLALGGAYEDRAAGRRVDYEPRRAPLGFVLMYGAGVLSGLLGIGSGPFKVLAMDAAMRIPMKVSTATSNFMIGVTASASAWIYLRSGYIEPRIAGPTALGAMSGAFAGSLILPYLSNKAVRTMLIPVLVWMGVSMIWKGWTHG